VGLLKGTKILTTLGYRSIEVLKVNDKVLTHEGKAMPILDISYKIVKWSIETPKEERIIRIPWRRPLFLTSDHIVWSKTHGKKHAWMGNLLSRKTDICLKSDFYEIYNIHIPNHEKNHLVVNLGKVVGAWAGLHEKN